MVPTRQSAPLLQEPSGPDPPNCGAAMGLPMLYGSYKAERTLVTGTKRTRPSYLRWNYRCYLTILVTKVPKIDSELMMRTGEGLLGGVRFFP